MSLDSLLQDIRTREFRKFYYFYGSEPYLQQFYLQQLRAAVLAEPDVDFYKFEDDRLRIESFCDAMALYPTLSEKKLVCIVYNPPAKSVSAQYLTKNPEIMNDETVLVFFEQKIKSGELPAEVKALRKTARETGLLVEIKPPDEATLRRWVQKQCRLLGLEMPPACANYFLECVQNDLYTVRGELQKLAAFCKDRPATDADVDRVCSRSPESQGFRVTDAILSRDAARAYRLLDDCAQARTPAEMTAGAIFKTVGSLYLAKYLAAQGASTAQITEQTGVRSFVLQKVKRTPLPAVEQMLDACVRTDLAIKTSGVDGYVLLARLTAELVELV